MSYRIPSDEEVVSAIQRVISRHHTITSQKRIKELVETELAKVDKSYRISGLRIRRLALKSKYFHLEINYKMPPEEEVIKSGKSKSAKTGMKTKGGKGGRGKKKQTALRTCPVCGSKVRKIKNRTLGGGSITTGFKCSSCPYHTGIPPRLPARYTFSIRRM